MRITLRKKLLFFSIVLALIPLGIAGNSLIRITHDELKSAANDVLSTTGLQLTKEIDDLYLNTWRGPLLLVRNALDNPQLGVSEKLSILTGISNIADVAALQLSAEGVTKPVLVIRDEYTDKLQAAGVDATERLEISAETIKALSPNREIALGHLEYFADVDSWLLTMVIPLQNELAGREATLSAQIDLERLRNKLRQHPLNQSGEIRLIDAQGQVLLGKGEEDIRAHEVVKEATKILESSSRTVGVFPYTRPDGEKMLGAFAFPHYFDWGLIIERRESDAYLAITHMVRNLAFLVIGGLLVSVIGAVVFSGRMSRPIVEIGRVAQLVGQGNFDVRAPPLKTNDEISELATRINDMVVGLKERFLLQKFVSGETIDAIKHVDQEGMQLGGERRNATVFFSDIRGFTAFSEKVEPETVILMLNTYLRVQAEIVRKHHGDIDKYVGDELVALFQGEHIVFNSVMCAIEIQDAVERLNQERMENWDINIGIGINSGDMIMGAMGSEDRMDFTILGDNVNLGARLCSHAAAKQILLSKNSYELLHNHDLFNINPLDPIKVKGKERVIEVYDVKSLPRPWPPYSLRGQNNGAKA